MDAKMTSDLPTEVWRIAWLSASTKDLKSLALTCRLFCEITQPLLFQKLSFVGPFPEELHFGGKALNKRVVERLKRSKIRFAFLSSTPRIAAMVRGWSFNTSPDFTCPAVAHGIGARIPNFKKVSQLSRDIVAQFNSTISVYTNLDKLFITGFDLSPEFSKALSSLPKLRILHMLHCRIDCPPASGSIALEEFSFSSQELEWTDALPESHHLVSGSKLVRLDLQEPVPARLFLSVLSTAGPLPHLMHTTLCLTYEAKDAFFAFLDCCPALETLDIVAPASFAGVILPESSIPLLASYKGPMELVGIFVPGRPVKIAKLDAAATYELPEEFTGDVIIDKEVMIEALMQLSQSSAPLEDITLPPVSTKWSVLFLIHELFPKLNRLMLFVQDVGVPWGAETFQPEFDDEPEANESGESDDSAGEEGDEDAEGIMTLPVGEEEDEEWEDMEEGDEDVEGIMTLPVGEEEDGEWEDMEEDSHFPIGPGIDGLRALMNMSAQDMEQMHEAMQKEVGDDHEHETGCGDCENCEDDRSDTETVNWPEDGPPTKTYEDLSLDSFKDFLISLGDDSTPLPYHLRYLGLCQMHESLDVKTIPDAEIFSVVEKLGTRYPGLNHIVVGKLPRAWKRKQGIWKHPKPPHSHPCGPMMMMTLPLPH